MHVDFRERSRALLYQRQKYMPRARTRVRDRAFTRACVAARAGWYRTDAILPARYGRTLHFDAPLSRHHLAWLKASPHQPPSFCSLTTGLEPSPSRRRGAAQRGAARRGVAVRPYPRVSQFFFELVRQSMVKSYLDSLYG